MSDHLIHLAQAGNTVVPAVLALESLGFTVEVHDRSVSASSDTARYTAGDPVAVLGLIKLIELRGEAWRPADSEVDETLRRYPRL